MKLLNILAEALSAEKEAALKAKFVNKKSKDDETQPEERDPNKISEKEFKALLDILRLYMIYTFPGRAAPALRLY